MKRARIHVLFNASVIFSAFRSKHGASFQLLKLVAQRKLSGIISETIFDETIKHAKKIPMDREKLKREITNCFPIVIPAPEEKLVTPFEKLVTDPGDRHLFATCKQIHATHLVSLDKHHVLALAGKIPNLVILPPAELLRLLKRKKHAASTLIYHSRSRPS